MRRDDLNVKPVNVPPHPAEWIIGAVSALFVAAMVVYLAYTALTEEDRPAAFDPRVEIVRELGREWHVFVTLRNVGGKTAADVMLRGASGSGEESETTFDYVPAGSQRQGVLIFAREPGVVALSVGGYVDP